MAQITAIKPQQRRSDRVSVYLDDTFWTGMSANALLDLGLAPGDEIDDERRGVLEAEILASEALYYCMDRCAERAYTQHQLAEKLRAREYPERVIEHCVQRCVELLLVDDEQYARDFAAARRNAGYGAGRVRLALTQKGGVSRDIVDRVVEEIFPSDDAAELASRALASRYGDTELPRSDQRRALAFLLRRGFDSGVARAAVDAQAMSAEDERAAEDPAQAVELLKRKYGASIGDRSVQSKAWAFLARRGWSSETIRVAVAEAAR